MNHDPKALLIGTWYGILAYILWGILPIYWKLLEHVPAGEVLSHRIVWSLVFMIVVLILMKKWGTFVKDLKEIFKQKKLVLGTLLASILISINWFTYIYAVNTDRIIETSLGYYINPLISVLLGVLVLKEKLSFWQMISCILALIGVLYLTIQFGSFPWMAFCLAISFGLYGLVKKMVNLGAMTGLTIETFMVTPVALGYIVFLAGGETQHFVLSDTQTVWLLAAGGAATAIPLLCFASGARRVPLSLLGFLQYIAPTLHLTIGVFMYHEPFTQVHLVSFILIWTALFIFSFGKTKWMTRLEPKAFKTKSLQG
ncbi:EamA family transporter RarD [Caldalkalibacillus salinus]|uniref:EamA family transporter RarD n=1 Tax=Caldalkalibacillus salinus TaxID=2803787 RepID=UPI0019226566|nr:EamA family transporter RarD [Caldalkalibacillus salinus]